MNLIDGVVFHGEAFPGDRAVVPSVTIFAQEAVAAEGDSFEKAVAVDGIFGVLRGTRAVGAANAIDWRDDFLEEGDDADTEVRRGRAFFLRMHQTAIFPPRLFCEEGAADQK